MCFKHNDISSSILLGSPYLSARPAAKPGRAQRATDLLGVALADRWQKGPLKGNTRTRSSPSTKPGHSRKPTSLYSAL